MRTYDDYLRSLESLPTYSKVDELERCPYCGEYHEELVTYRDESMCFECSELERENDAEKSLSPNFDELFKTA